MALIVEINPDTRAAFLDPTFKSSLDWNSSS